MGSWEVGKLGSWFRAVQSARTLCDVFQGSEWLPSTTCPDWTDAIETKMAGVAYHLDLLIITFTAGIFCLDLLWDLDILPEITESHRFQSIEQVPLRRSIVNCGCNGATSQ